MATLSASFTQHYPSQQNSLARAHVSATVTYTTSQSNSAVTISASNISVGAISVTGQESLKSAAKSALTSALSSMTARLVIYNGATIVSKTGLAPSTSYTVSGSTSINRSTSAQSITLDFYLGNTYGVTTITIPARPSYSVTYNANSGSGAPSTQTKYYDYNLALSSGRPTKTDHTFLGWATSTARAGTTPPSIDYNPSQTYSGNAALALYAIWKRNYTKPTLNNLKVDRCSLKDGDYVLDDDGGYAKVAFEWSVFRTTDALYYGGSDYAYEDNEVAEDGCEITVGLFTAYATLTGQSGTYSAIVGDGTFDTDTAYPVAVSITDMQEVVSDNTTTITGELSKAKFPIDINADATAIAFLTTAPDDDEGVFCPDMTAQEVQDFVDSLDVHGESIEELFALKALEYGTLTVYACTGTISHNQLAFITTKGGEICVEGRVNINSFTRTGSNPGVNIALPTSIPTPTKTREFLIGFRSQSPREMAVFRLEANSRTARLMTTESYANATNGTLTLVCSGRIFVE